MLTDSPTAQRRNIIQSPLWPCELNSDLKYFMLYIIHLEVTHTKNCYPSSFSYKVIGRRRGENPDGGGIHSSLCLTHADGGSW